MVDGYESQSESTDFESCAPLNTPPDPLDPFPVLSGEDGVVPGVEGGALVVGQV